MARPVLLLSNHGEIVGGGEISLLALLEGLDRVAWAPVVVAPAEGAFTDRCRRLGLPLHLVPFPTLWRPGPAMLRSIAAVRRLIHQTGACLVHANGSRAMFYAGLAARRLLPVIWHVRVSDRDRLLDRLLTGLATAIIVNSRAVGGRFPSAAQARVRCVHNGVDLARFAPRQVPPTLRGRLALPAGVPLLVSVGRFVPYKGYHHLLEAARLVAQARPEAHWLLVGDGELRGKLEAQCRGAGLESRVRFLGWREDVPDLLALSDLFVLPSLGEHFGRVLIEAMAAGRPVVATDAGGVPEIVRHGQTGLLVPPGEARPLAEAVLALLGDPARAAAMGKAGLARAEQEFSLTTHIQAVEALYRNLAGERE